MSRSLLLVLSVLLVLLPAVNRAAEKSRTSSVGGAHAADHQEPQCLALDAYFTQEVWGKVAEQICLKCHRPEGDASDTEFLLQDPRKQRDSAAATRHNRTAFQKMAAKLEKGKPRILVKVTGGLDHGGGEVLKPNSPGYQVLARFVRRVQGTDKQQLDEAIAAARELPPYFDGIRMISPPRLLRRVTLSLAGRLPTKQEQAAIEKQGQAALTGILDKLMREDAFYERLTEGFNDIFLTLGYDGVAENVLSYDHFNKTRHWYQKYDLSDVPEDKRTKARYKLTDDYRDAIRREPLELIRYIVQNDRPFTELATADYIMVSPYTARGYGIYEELREKFKNPDDPFEYIPTRLAALTNRGGKTQPSETGFYPHSGMLSMFHYLRRYPTTETNRNRARARMYYGHFLGIDVMQLAPQVTDAAAVAKQFDNPTMQAPDCVVCHKTIDPVAGLFQDYYNKDGYYGPRKDGWFKDMFGPGLEGEDLPESERWRALQWLGERTAKDPRFATAMVEHVYYILMGRKVLEPPQDLDDPLFAARRRAYEEQRKQISQIAAVFANSDFNLKSVFKAWVASPFYQADGLATVAEQPQRQAELEDIGLVRMLGPEQLERKLAAVLGKKWGQLDDKFKILYGGIDSKLVTERITNPSGAMGAIQRIMANDMACQTVAVDFTTPPDQRRLFPHIELDVVPGEPAANKQIREAIVHLHAHLLGQTHSVDHPEVERTYQLFAGIVGDAGKQKSFEKRESYFCRGADDKRVDDPHYTLRAWRAVVTYLLRQHDFLYE